MLVNMEKMLEDAKRNNYAIAHFNINNLEWTRFILEECNETVSPVILGVSEGAIKYMGGYNTVYNIVSGLINDLNITVPVALHLDHGSSIDSCRKAINAGFTSVMIDASQEDLDTNIAMTKQIVDYAKNYMVTVEAEIGHIGETNDNMDIETAYARVDEAVTLVEATHIDFLAPALGSVHGLYKGEPKLDFVRMKEISEKTRIPLVLHGGTGIPDNQIKQAIASGICKININTDLQVIWSQEVRKYLSNNTNVYDPRKIIKSGELAMKKLIKDKLILFGSIGMANNH